MEVVEEVKEYPSPGKLIEEISSKNPCIEGQNNGWNFKVS